MKISALICLLLALSGISAGESRIGQQGLSPDYVDPNGRFEKLMVYGKTLKMGFKRVDFLPGGLPGKIRVYQHDILAAPVELEMVINGKMQSGTKRVSLRKNGKVVPQGSRLLQKKRRKHVVWQPCLVCDNQQWLFPWDLYLEIKVDDSWNKSDVFSYKTTLLCLY